MNQPYQNEYWIEQANLLQQALLHSDPMQDLVRSTLLNFVASKSPAEIAELVGTPVADLSDNTLASVVKVLHDRLRSGTSPFVSLAILHDIDASSMHVGVATGRGGAKAALSRGMFGQASDPQ